MQRNLYVSESQNQRKRTYAIVVLLPQDLDELIYPIREKFDPDYNKVPGHVTVVFPFDSKASFNELSAVISYQLQSVQPFEIELDSIADFYPHSPIIYWQVKPCEALQKLYRNLHAELDLPIPFSNYLPHVTVAREISSHRVMLVKERILPGLPQEKFKVSSLDLIIPIVGERWVSARTFSLESPDNN